MFANDIILFPRTVHAEITRLLEVYQTSFGQLVNKLKSSYIFPKGISDSQRSSLLHSFKLKPMTVGASYGGLGLRNMCTMNLSLLSKLAFRVMSTPTSLLTCILMAKYKKQKGWFSTNALKSANPIAPGLLTLQGNVLYANSNGNSIQNVLTPRLIGPLPSFQGSTLGANYSLMNLSPHWSINTSRGGISEGSMKYFIPWRCNHPSLLPPF